MTIETTERRGPARVDERYARPLFILTIVTGSFLLFLTQPMIARMALPRIGGAPSVWNSAMLVYQALLLAGYAYAHWVSKIRPRQQVGIHLVLLGLAALWLPIGLSGALPPVEGSPFFWVPWFLLASIGPVFFIVSAQAPLMQRWYALETSRGDPYPLYAASNLGSFAGLISYPLLVEPLMSLNQQSWLWTALYAFLVLLVVGCALTVPANAVEYAPEEDSAPPTTKTYLHWIALAAVPSGLMLSTTTHLTTDIVAMPLLWVMPLSLYLLSFVIAFAERRRPAELITIVAPLIILIAGGLAMSVNTQTPMFSATLGLILLFVIAVGLHSRLFELRPAVGQLTKFYLAMSFGGMLGGLFCAIVAPLVFDWAYEHPILILAAALLIPQQALVPWSKSIVRPMMVVLPLAALVISVGVYATMFARAPGLPPFVGTILISLLTLACLGQRIPFAIGLAALMLSYVNYGGGWELLRTSLFEADRTRSYFGIFQVNEAPDGSYRSLMHGTTLHGRQNLTPGLETVPTTYYARRSGVGLALTNANAIFGRPASVGVVGLGSGTLSCYRQPGQHWTIYEIDPQMVEVARNRFTFLSRCAPDAQIVLGDARISLRDRTAPNSLDILAVDAFSSDAVPMHLLTREALAEYGRAVRPDGIVLFHISNRFLDLKPVVADLAASGRWFAREFYYVPTKEDSDLNATISVWIALSRSRQTIDRLVALSGDDALSWEALDPTPGFAGWTDDHASILPILNYPSWMPFVGRR